MRALRGELLLEAWERGAADSDLRRPLALLETACRDTDQDDFAAMSIAERDRELLRLRQLSFGDSLRGVLPCSSCSTRMEFEISIDSISSGRELPDRSKWSVGGFAFVMRAVTTRDLAKAIAAADPRKALLRSCIEVQSDDSMATLAEHEDYAIAEFNRLNREAETRLTLPCPACGEITQADLDIGRFLWAEVSNAALMLLRDVHELASVYGWREEDVLGMTSVRRATYLEMVRA